MNQELESNKYFVVRDAIPKDFLELFNYYYSIKFFIKRDFECSIGTISTPNPDSVQPASIFSYADSLSESLLLKMLPDMRNITGIKELEPTYSYTRMYEKGQYLIKHRDRKSCQYSVTLPMASYDERTWTIYLDDNAVELNLGDLLVYKGCEALHWREPCESPYHIQAHLHYVNSADPEYAPFVNDSRPSIGGGVETCRV